MPNDPEVLRKYIINLIMEFFEFQDKVKDSIRQLIEQKHVAQHTANLLEVIFI